MRRSRHARSTHLRPFRGLLQHLSLAAPPSKSTSADFERNRLSLRGPWRVCKQRSCGQRIAPTIGGCRLFRPSRKISRTAFATFCNPICHSSTAPQRETEPSMSELNARLHLEAWIEVVTQAVAEQIEGEYCNADGNAREQNHPRRLTVKVSGIEILARVHCGLLCAIDQPVSLTPLEKRCPRSRPLEDLGAVLQA